MHHSKSGRLELEHISKAIHTLFDEKYPMPRSFLEPPIIQPSPRCRSALQPITYKSLVVKRKLKKRKDDPVYQEPKLLNQTGGAMPANGWATRKRKRKMEWEPESPYKFVVADPSHVLTARQLWRNLKRQRARSRPVQESPQLKISWINMASLPVSTESNETVGNSNVSSLLESTCTEVSECNETNDRDSFIPPKPPIVSEKKRRQFEDTFRRALYRGIRSMIKEILMNIPDPVIWDDITRALTTILKDSQAETARPRLRLFQAANFSFECIIAQDRVSQLDPKIQKRIVKTLGALLLAPQIPFKSNYSHLHVREHTARLFVSAHETYKTPSREKLLRLLIARIKCRTTTLDSLYGLVKGVTGLGFAAIKTVLIPHLDFLHKERIFPTINPVVVNPKTLRTQEKALCLVTAITYAFASNGQGATEVRLPSMEFPGLGQESIFQSNTQAHPELPYAYL